MRRKSPLVIALVAVFSAVPVARGRSAAGESPFRPARIVRVVTISQDGLPRGTNDLLHATMSRLDRAGASFHPDIACLPEMFSNRPPEPVLGPVTKRLAAWARMYSSYVIFGLRTKQGETVYNSAILLDRHGRLVGYYNKMHPTEQEIKDGTTPGQDAGPPVFHTDFGTIGVQICYDVNWRNEWRRLKDEGARIVFFPAAYPAALQLQALALWNEYFVVSSPVEGPAHVYDITGRVLASSGRYQEWAGAALPLGERLFEIDYNAAKAQEIQQRYGSRVEINWYHYSDWFTLASLDPDLTVEGLIKEYGLTPLDAYIGTATKVINQARSGAETKTEAVK